MRTISWTKPAIILVAAAIAAACGSDDAAPGSTDAGLKAKCGNGKLDTGEVCDGANLGGKTCATATGMMGSTGTPTCDSSCKLVTTACKAGGSGGTPGTGGVMGNGGSVGGSAGKGGTAGKGGGGGASGAKTDGGTSDSGSGGAIPDASGD